MLYGDCDFYEWEIEILHTPIMQRMYNIKQLGFTDKVFPDAIHSRFNHVLGVASRADKIINGVLKSLNKEKSGSFPNRKTFRYTKNAQISISDLINHIENRRKVIRLIALLHDIGHIPFGHTLEDELKIFSVSHDDPARQVSFFNILIKEFIYAIIIGYCPEVSHDLIEIVTNNENSEDDISQLIEDFKIAIESINQRHSKSNAATYADIFFDLESCMIALLHLEDLHKDRLEDHEHRLERDTAIKSLLVTRVIQQCELQRPPKHKAFDIYLDAFTLDIIGNTICADLLDYVKRDCKQAGLMYDYDDRIFKYFTIASYKPNKKSDPIIHLCLQLFTNKLRSDVASEIITVLRTRYLLSERILYHPTKCAAGAMLGCAVYMMGIDKAELDFFRIGDSEFLRLLEQHVNSLCMLTKNTFNVLTANPDAKKQFVSLLETRSNNDKDLNLGMEGFFMNNSISVNTNHPQNQSKAFSKIVVEEFNMTKRSSNNQELFDDVSLDNDRLNVIIERIQSRSIAARKLVWQIQSRQYFKKIFRISRIDDSSVRIKNDLATLFENATFRYAFERKIETECDLPYGTIVVHCPKFNTSYKEANVLVFGMNPDHVIPLKEINDASHELISLNDYVKETKALETSYLSIWNMYFYVQQSQVHKWPFITIVIERFLNKELGTNGIITNSNDLRNQLKQDYEQPAKKLLEVIEYIASEECNPKPNINYNLVNFIESEAYQGRRDILTPKEIVLQWNKKLANEAIS